MLRTVLLLFDTMYVNPFKIIVESYEMQVRQGYFVF